MKTRPLAVLALVAFMALSNLGGVHHHTTAAADQTAQPPTPSDHPLPDTFALVREMTWMPATPATHRDTAETTNLPSDTTPYTTSLQAEEDDELPPGVTDEWWTAVQAEIARSEYEIVWRERTYLDDLTAAYQAPNRAQNLRTYFTPEGIRIVPRVFEGAEPPWEWGLRLTGYGYLGRTGEVEEAAAPRVEGNYIEYRRGPLVEWYVNDTRGLEQGFTLHEPPAGSGSEALIELALTGDLTPTLGADGEAIEFTGSTETVILRYGELRVHDATGRALPARLALSPDRKTIRILFDPTAAVYPITVDPLATTTGWVLYPDQAGAGMGFSVGLAGDVNGDGFDDIIVGAYAYSETISATVYHVGRAYLFYGSPAGPSLTNVWIAQGEYQGGLVGEILGQSVGTAGDVNGDGYDDVIIGAPLYTGVVTHEGRVLVYYGSEAGLGATPDWVAEGGQEEAEFGFSVGTAGDVNGDGYDDVIIGTPYYDGDLTDKGQATIYYGSPTGLSTAPAWSVEGNGVCDNFGNTVSTAGDVNDDGYGDIIVGAYAQSGCGSGPDYVYVYYGSAGGLSNTPDWTIFGWQGIGKAVGAAGDVDGDGYDDILIGEPYYHPALGYDGRASLYNGSAAGLLITPTWVITGDRNIAEFGAALGTAGDINQDGYDDIIVSAPRYDIDDDYSPDGQVRIYYGSAGGPSTTPDWSVLGTSADSGYFGYSVSTAGDVNGDGQVEVVVGAPFFDFNALSNSGAAFVYHVASEGTPSHPLFYDWMVVGKQAPYPEWLGLSLDTAGDVNDDGFDDVLIGAPGYEAGVLGVGRAYLFLGSAAGLPITATWFVEGHQELAALGQALSAAGDVNGDGYDDVLIGEPYYDEGTQQDTGRVHLFYGSAAGLSLSATQTITGPQAGAYFGEALDTAGDVNGDGYDDVIIGAPFYTNGETREGAAFVYHGSATGLPPTYDWSAEGDWDYAHFGEAVSTAGDVNGDGYDDVAIGAPSYTNGQYTEGKASLYYGSATGLSTTPAWEVESNIENSFWGRTVSTAGDINGDGYADIAVSSSFYTSIYIGSGAGLPLTATRTLTGYPNVSLAGDVNGDGYADLIFPDYPGVALYYGAADGLSPTPDWSVRCVEYEPGDHCANFGEALSAAGDVNGDDYDDFLIGAHEYQVNGHERGAAFAFYGSPNGPHPPDGWSRDGVQADSYLGTAVSTAGDVDGDGYSDFAIGAPWYDDGVADAGQVSFYPGSPAGPPLTATWTITGGQAGARLGYAVALAGDVDGDGYADLAVGAPGYDGTGAVFLYPGSPAGPPLTATWTVTGGQPGADFGFALGTAGDVDGDGFDDLLVGAPNADHGEASEGRLYVYPGSPSGLPTTTTWTFESNQPYARLGYAVGTAGDVDGDGYADIIAAAPWYDDGETNEGRAYLFRGSPTGPLTPSWTVEGDQEYAYLGRSLATAGDVNGDGYADLLIGVPAYDGAFPGEGQARLYYGSATGPSPTPDWTVEGGHTGYGLGDAVGTAGDVNGDGYADFLIGVPYYDNGETDEGQVLLYHGSAAGPGTAPDWTRESDEDYAHFGRSLGTAGDVNGDGLSDIIIGAPGYGIYEVQMHLGRALLYYGELDLMASSPAWSDEGDQGGAWFGYAVGTAGDVNGDGFADLVVGAPLYDHGEVDEGMVFVYHGSATGPSPTPDWSAESDQAWAEFGWAVSTAGDVNDDGYDDLLIGARRYDNGHLNEGRAYLYHGSPTGLSSTPNWTAEANQSAAWFGSALSAAGDVNGDGYADVIIGAQYYDGDLTNEGRAYLYTGSYDGLSSTPDWTAEGDQENARFGFAVSSAGDLNGDGYSDVAIGAPYYDQAEADAGEVRVYYGSATGLPITATWTAEGDQAGGRFGQSVSSAGDVNGDGFADLLIGAPGYDHGHIDEGWAFVYSGSASGLSSAPLWTMEGNQDDADFGCAVSSAGDVDGDGFADILVGARSYDDGETDEGRVYLYRGSRYHPVRYRAWSVEGDRATARLGHAVGAAGDVNGDGYADIIVGGYSYANGESGEGGVFLFYGNGGAGWPLRPRQMRSNGHPVSRLGTSDSRTAFILAMTGRTPLGREPVQLEWQAAPPSTPFTAPETLSGTSGWSDAMTGNVEITHTVTGLTPTTAYHWRVRFIYPPGNATGQPRGPWIHLPWGGWNETTLRTACIRPPVANAGAAQTAFPATTVTLDGSGSYAPYGGALSYGWLQQGGPHVPLAHSTAVSASFTTPPTVGLVLTFTLHVTDSDGLTDTAQTSVTLIRREVYLYLPLLMKGR